MNRSADKLFHWLGFLLQLIYPPICISCRNVYSGYSELKGICPDCLSSIQPVPSKFVKEQILLRLENCFLDNLFVCTGFSETIQSIIHHFKYDKMNQLALQAGKYAHRYVPANFDRLPIDFALPVPLHPFREKERGYNQSKYLAKGFFDSTKIVVDSGLLKRSRNTPSQTALNRKERQHNVLDAFIYTNPQKVKGNSFLLVDDVITTGATLNECARILKEGGATWVAALTLATPTD